MVFLYLIHSTFVNQNVKMLIKWFICCLNCHFLTQEPVLQTRRCWRVGVIIVSSFLVSPLYTTAPVTSPTSRYRRHLNHLRPDMDSN